MKDVTTLTGTGFVDPQRNALQNLFPNRLARHRRCEELPVRFRVEMPAIQGKPVTLTHVVVPITLHLINAWRNKARRAAAVSMMFGMVLFLRG